MDPDIVNNPAFSGTIVNDLKAIPTISVVTDKENLFNASYGIYVNPGQDGDGADPSYPDPISPPQQWERRASVELINPDGSPGFGVNCGIRLRGGYSRSTNNPKHALRVFFRDQYGAGSLKFDLNKNAPFGSTSVKEFKKFDLRCAQNYSWSFDPSGGIGIFVRDVVARDMQLAMGQPSSHGSFYHLYLNGQYWGLFNVDERPEANYGESYFGGNPDDYDTIKCDPDSGYNIEATDGNLAAWTQFWTLADQTLPAAGTEVAKNGIYQQMKGNNPDGTPNAAYPVLLEDVGLIDEMLIVYWGGNLDAPISNFLGNTSPNNFYVLRNRLGVSGGFKGVLHDSEHTLLVANTFDTGSAGDRTGPWSAGQGNLSKSNPQYIFQQLVQHSSDFRTLFADRVYVHMANGGVLTPSGATAIFETRISEIDRAVVGESARWGDSKSGTPYTRNNWLSAVANVRNTFFTARTGVVLGQFRNKGWYPTFESAAVESTRRNGPSGNESDAHAPGQCSGREFDLLHHERHRSAPAGWGAESQCGALFRADPDQCVEIHPDPGEKRDHVERDRSGVVLYAAGFYEPGDHGDQLQPAADGCRGGRRGRLRVPRVQESQREYARSRRAEFHYGITYTFPAGTTLGPGQFFLLIRNASKFASRYPGVSLAPGTYGIFTKTLDNGGENLTIATSTGGIVLSLDYNDGAPWPAAADGNGFTIVPSGGNYNSSEGTQWRASANLYGSPRADDPPVFFPNIVINEILTNSGVGQVDTIELYNPGPGSVNVSDWWLTDDPGIPKKFRIPPGTVIPANGYISFDESQFNTGGAGFAFNSAGDDAYLFSGNAAGDLTGYSHGFDFAGGELNRSFGRYVNSVGEEQFPRQISNTFGAANAGPLVGPLVISEIMYHPYAGYDEYIEIRNISAGPVALYDSTYPANLWKIGGLNYTFPANQTIPAGGMVLVVNIDPAAFRTKYAIPAGVTIYGPYTGTLQDSGERLSLEMPDTPILDGQGLTVLPYDVIDTVRYNDKAPWPNEADGTGPSLQRTTPSVYGDDPASWFANGATPGLANSINTLPSIALTAPADGAAFTLPSSIQFTTSAVDPDGSILKVEYLLDGTKVGESTVGPTYAFNWTATGGAHTLAARAIDNSLGSVVSAPRLLYVTQAVTQGLKGEFFANTALQNPIAGCEWIRSSISPTISRTRRPPGRSIMVTRR
jgi:hypothetical protein